MEEQKKNEKEEKLSFNKMISIIDYFIDDDRVLEFLINSKTEGKILSFLQYYNEDSQNEELPSKKLCNKYEVNDKLKAMIQELSQNLKMSKKKSFELLEIYLYENTKNANDLIDLINLNRINSNVDELFNQQFLFYNENIIDFYYSERKCFLAIISKLLIAAYSTFSNNQVLKDYFDDISKNKNFLNKMWEQFTSYEENPIRNIQIINQKNNHIPLDRLNEQIFWEQKIILECMNIICNNDEFCNIEIFKKLIDYFYKTKFTCYAYKYNNGHYDNTVKELVDRSVAFTILNFQPEKLRARYENKILDNSLNAFNINIDQLLQFFDDVIGINNIYPIQCTIEAVIKIMEKIDYNHFQDSIKKFSDKTIDIDSNNIEEVSFLFFKDMISSYSIPSLKEGGNYFERSSNFMIKSWINLIMTVLYNYKINSYPLSLIELMCIVLNSPICREQFFDDDEKSNTAIYRLFTTYKNNKNYFGNFINMCFPLSSPKIGDENSKNLFDMLIDNDDNDGSFFSNILDTWKNLNNTLSDGINNISMKRNLSYDNDENNDNFIYFYQNVEYVRLFIRLLTSDYRNITSLVSLFENKDVDIYSELTDKNNYSTLLQLAMNSLYFASINSSINSRDELINNYIKELFRLFIYFFTSPKCPVLKFISENKNYTEQLSEIIYSTLKNDYINKNYKNTLLALKLIRECFQLKNFIIIFKENYGKHFLRNIFFYTKEAVNNFSSIHSFETLDEPKLIKILFQIMSNILLILINNCNIDKRIILEENIEINQDISINNMSEDNISNLNNNLYNSKDEVISFIISLLNQEGQLNGIQNQGNDLFLLDLIFRILTIKFYNNNSLNNLSNDYMYAFANMFLEKLEKKYQNVYSPLECSSYLRKMFVSIFFCLKQILNLCIIVQLNPKSKISECSIIKNFSYCFYNNKEIPKYLTESTKLIDQYEINLLLILFIYSNYEKIHNLIFEYRGELKSIFYLNSVTMQDYICDPSTNDSDYNIASLCFDCLTKLIFLLKDVNVNIMNSLTLRKINSNEIDSRINLFEYIRRTIKTNLSEENYFLINKTLQFLNICSVYQINFISSFFDNEKEEDNTFKILFNMLENAQSQLNFDDDDGKEKEIYNIIGQCIYFVSYLLSNDVIYKKIIKNLINNIDGQDFLDYILKLSIDNFQLKKENYDILNQKIKDISYNYSNNKQYYLYVNETENETKKFCFILTVVKQISFIYTKLILLTDDDKNNLLNSLSSFIKINIVNLINIFSNDNEDFNNDLLVRFNKNFTKEKIPITLKNFEIPKKNERLITHFIIGDSLFEYGINYAVDLREMLIKLISLREENLIEQFSQLISFNLNSSLTHAKTQAMINALYSIGFLFGISEENYAMTSTFFTDSLVFEIIQKNPDEKFINDEMKILLKIGQKFNPKLNFSPLKHIFSNNPNEAISFINTSFLSIYSYLSNIRNPIIKNYIYDLLNNVIDYTLYLTRIQKKISTLSPQYLINILGNIVNDMDYSEKDLSNYNNLMLSMITLSYSILIYFIKIEYNCSRNDFQLISQLLSKLNICYQKQIEYRAVITYIFCSCIYLIYNINEQEMQSTILGNINEFIKSIVSIFNEKTSDIEYQSFIMLIIRLIDFYPNEGMNVILNQKIFISIKLRFTGNTNDLSNFYIKNEHTISHYLYCWTLKLLAKIMEVYDNFQKEEQIKYYIIYKNSVDFLLDNSQRILNLLNNCGYIDSNGNNDVKSLAFIEEVNVTTEVLSLISVIESDSSDFKQIDMNILEFLFKCTEIMILKGLKLFETNYVRLNNLYSSFSDVEKYMEEIKLESKKNNNNNDKNYSPFINNNNSNFTFGLNYNSTGNYNIYSNMIANSNNGSLSLNSNISNLFLYRIEILLVSILFNISSTLKELLSREEYSYRQYIFDIFIENQNNLNLFEEQTQNVLNSFYYAVRFLDNFVKNKKSYQIMHSKSVIFYNNINTGINMGFFNLAYGEFELKDIFMLNNYTLLNLLYIGTELNDGILYFSRYYRFNNQFDENYVKTMQNLKGKLKERSECSSYFDGNENSIIQFNNMIEKAIDKATSRLTKDAYRLN